jgi:DNA repair exonuclease SbcCD ATPase subunit
MINFKCITIEGFGSINNPVKLDLSEKGLHIIKGANGAGKTTIFNALAWCLYQVNLKGLLNADVTSWYANRGTAVELQFEKDGIEYEVTRYQNFKAAGGSGNKLVLKKNGETYNGQHKADQQEELVRILGMNSNVFLNSFLFGQRAKRFIEADNSEKRDILESLYDLSFIDKAAQIAKSGYDVAKEQIATLEKEQQYAIGYIEQASAHLKQIEEENQTRATRYLEELENTNNLIAINAQKLEDTRKLRLAAATEQSRQLSLLDTKKNSVTDEISELENEIAEIMDVLRQASTKMKVGRNLYNKELAETMDKLSKVDTACSSCGATPTAESIEKTREQLKNKVAHYQSENARWASIYETYDGEQAKVQMYSKNVQTLREGLAKVDSSAYQAAASELKRLDSEIVSIEKLQVHYKAQLELLQSQTREQDTTLTKVSIAKKRATLKELEEGIEGFKEEIAKYAWWKDAFSANGIKSFILESTLDNLNRFIAVYASRMNMKATISMETEKHYKNFKVVCGFNGRSADYKALSGGERQRIDVAMALGLHDLVAHTGTKMSILVMDEIFENLDAEGIETIFDLLRQKESVKSIYVITHQEGIDSLNAKIITVSNTNGNSKIIWV